MNCKIVKEMTNRITLHGKTKVPDGIGGHTSSFGPYADRWAKIKSISGRERYHAERLEVNISHLITIRYDAAITTEHRIEFDNRFFDIKYIINKDESKKEFLELHCTEGIPS